VHAGGLALQIVAAYSEYTKSLPKSMSVTNKAQSGPVVVITLTPSDFNFFKDAKNEEAEYVSASSKYQLVLGYLEKDLAYFTAELTTAQNGIDDQLEVEKLKVDNKKSALEVYVTNNATDVAYNALQGVLRDREVNVGQKVRAKVTAKATLDAALKEYGKYPSPKIIGGVKGLKKSVDRLSPRQKTA
jgi:nitrogen-specific signal transduction histidine kinase